MKKAFTVLVFVILSITVLSAAFIPSVSFSEEIAYQKYNRIWTSPNSYFYSVESIASNPTICNEFDIMFSKNIGMTVGTSFGYQWSIRDANRFVSFPKNINGTINLGVAFKINNVRASLSAVLRSSFQTARNSWISQVGGEADVSYIFDNGLFLELGFRYLYCYENVTSGVTIGAGYQFGGAR